MSEQTSQHHEEYAAPEAEVAETREIRRDDIPKLVRDAFFNSGIGQILLQDKRINALKPDLQPAYRAAKAYLVAQTSAIREAYQRFHETLPLSAHWVERLNLETQARFYARTEATETQWREAFDRHVEETRKLVNMEAFQERPNVPKTQEVRDAWIQGQIDAMAGLKTKKERIEAWTALKTSLDDIKLFDELPKRLERQREAVEEARQAVEEAAHFKISEPAYALAELRAMFRHDEEQVRQKQKERESLEEKARVKRDEETRKTQETLRQETQKERERLETIALHELFDEAMKFGDFDTVTAIAKKTGQELAPAQYAALGRQALEQQDYESAFTAITHSEDPDLAQAASSNFLSQKKLDQAKRLRTLAVQWRNKTEAAEAA